MKVKTKQEIVEQFSELYKNSKCIAIIDCKGMNAEATSAFRGDLRQKCGVKFYVLKNTLNKKSMEGTSFADYGDLLQGQCGVVFCEDLLSASKVINQYCFKDKKAKCVACIEGGKKLEESEIKELATMPSMEELRVKLLYLLNSTGSSLVRTLNEAVNSGRKTDN